MKKLKLKNTDLELSNICYGTGNFGERLTKEEAFRNLDLFAAAGGNFIDTANVYCRWVPGMKNCSEQFIGEWLKSRSAYNKVVIATKGGHYDLKKPEVSRINPAEVRKDLLESLQTLGLSQIDFYWLHRDDPEMEIEAIVDMMEQFVREGLIRYYGASNYRQDRMEAAVQYAQDSGIQGFSAVSNQWSLASVNTGEDLKRDKTLVMMDGSYYQWHQKTGMPMVPYSSGAHGYFQKLYEGKELTEKLRRTYENDKNSRIFETLAALHQETGVSVHVLSLAWLLNQPFEVFPVVSATRPEQLNDFFAASELEVSRDFAASTTY